MEEACSMKAAILYKPNSKLEIEEVDINPPKHGEVLVKMVASGVCHSDWHVIEGGTPHPLPAILGHEGAGIVMEVGENVSRVKVGDHVVLSWVPVCGECFYCLKGQPAQCENAYGWAWKGTLQDGSIRYRLDGRPIYHYSGISTFAEMSVVSETSCVPVRRDVPLTVAALVGCAISTGFGAVLHTAKVQAGDLVAVFGCGGVGLNIIQGAALCGAEKIIAVDISPHRLSLAHSMGATHMVDSTTHDAVSFVRDLTYGRGADHVFEAIGKPEIMQKAYQATRIGGNTLLVGIGPVDHQVCFSAADLPRQSKRILSSYYGGCDPRIDFRRILDLYAARKIRLDEFVSRTYPLREINEAFQDMLAGEVARGVILFD
jgi:S-(hydroxymethyl)glutathione dehydrogenase/alcohol dehydrogenase